MNVLIRKGRQISGQDQIQWTMNGISLKGRKREKGGGGLPWMEAWRIFSLQKHRNEGAGSRARHRDGSTRQVQVLPHLDRDFPFGLMDAVMHHVLLIAFNYDKICITKKSPF